MISGGTRGSITAAASGRWILLAAIQQQFHERRSERTEVDGGAVQRAEQVIQAFLIDNGS